MNDILQDSDIQLDGGSRPSYSSRRILGEPETPKMVQFLVKIGIVKKPEQAIRVLGFIMLACFILAGVLIYKIAFDTPPPLPPLNIDTSVNPYI